jgi:hypothetical protein
VDQGQSLVLTASVVNDPSAKGVTWSVSCATAICGSLSSQTPTATTFTAPSPVAASLAVKIVATSAADNTKSASAAISVAVPPSVTTSSLPGATGGSAYSAILQEAGGVAPFVWTVTSGSLPAGLSLGGDGSISGTPTAGGTSNFTVQIADSGNPPLTASANLSIKVVVLPLSIKTTLLPDATVDTPYKQTIQATGGIPPYVWTLSGGVLPSWGTLNSSTGILNGIPSVTGTDNFTVKVTDSEATALSATQPLSLTAGAAAVASDSELSGHYAFLFYGFDDLTGSQIAVAGSFNADGKGKITAGVEDENGPGGPALSVPFTGTYNIASDHRGAFTLITAGGSKTYTLVLNSLLGGVAQKARFAEFDDTTGTSGQRGSGILRAQDTAAFSLAKINGPYAFGLAGRDSTGNREALAGSFSADGTGAITIGVEDQSIAGTVTNPSLTGSYTAPSGTNGRASMILNSSSGPTLDFSVYVISPSEILAISKSSFSSDGVVSGEILSQTSSSFGNSALNAAAVFYQLGVNSAAPTSESLAEVGLLLPDGNGNFAVTHDEGLVSSSFKGTYSTLTGGKVALSGWSGDSTSPLRILYLVDKNKAFFLDTSAAAGLGFLEAQTAPSGGFTNSSFTGTFSAGTSAPGVTGSANGTGLATLDGAGSFSESTDVSVDSGLFVDQTTTGTYSIASNGRGAVTSLTVTNAGFSWLLFALAIVAAFLLHRGNLRGNSTRSRLAMFCVVILMATTTGGCPFPHFTNKLVFYIVSPAKAIMIHESSFTHAPEITFFEQ